MLRLKISLKYLEGLKKLMGVSGDGERMDNMRRERQALKMYL
jgi:hypothetical protein